MVKLMCCWVRDIENVILGIVDSWVQVFFVLNNCGQVVVLINYEFRYFVDRQGEVVVFVLWLIF